MANGSRGSLAVWGLVLLIIVVLVLALLFLSASSRQRGGVSASISQHVWGNVTVIPTGVSVPYARLYVIVDNNPWNSLRASWGLSIFVETPSGNVLFDTGPDPGTLAYNAKRLGIDPCNVSAVVISHEHMDHVGGLAYIAHHCPDIPIYVPSGISRSVLSWIRSLGLHNIRVVNITTIVVPGVYVLPPLWGPPAEESLAINTSRGLVLLVGCSHPGVARIVRHAEQLLSERVLLLMGGFHLAWAPKSEVKRVVKDLVGLGVEYIAPIHCSGSLMRSILASDYPSHYVGAHVGTVVVIGDGCSAICVR